MEPTVETAVEPASGAASNPPPAPPAPEQKAEAKTEQKTEQKIEQKNDGKPDDAKFETSAKIADAAEFYRGDRDSRRECLERLSPAARPLVPLDDAAVDNWVTRLHEHRVLMLSCVDPHILNAAARTLPYHTRFELHEKLVAMRRDAPTVWEILDARSGRPAVVVAYAVDGLSDRFLQNLTSDPFWLDSIQDRLKTSATWLLVLTTPKSAAAAGFKCAEHSWTETIRDFIGPRLRAVFGAEASALEAEFARQRERYPWGASDERCFEQIDIRIANHTLKAWIEQLRRQEYGQAADVEPLPDWPALLDAEHPDERLLNELILFVAAYFGGHPDETLIGLPVGQFDAAVRALIPIAARDAGETPPNAVAAPAAQRLRRRWVLDGERLRAACGLQAVKANQQPHVMAAFRDPLWRDSLGAHFDGPEQCWRFTRLASYVRRPEFILGPPHLARGAKYVAVLQIERSADYDDRVLLDWILACAPPAATEAERLGALMPQMPIERRIALAAWVADVVIECNQPERARVTIGRLIDARAYDLAAAILARLWRSKPFHDVCLTLAKRLLSEAPKEIKGEVSVQMRRAVQRADLRLTELWQRGWISAASKELSVPACTAADLLVGACQSSLAGARSHMPLRSILQDANPEELRALVAWLWHPAVEASVGARDPLITALPGLWLIPPELRRRLVDEPWEAGQVLLTAWWLGYAMEHADIPANVQTLTLLFRTLTLADCIGYCADAANEAALAAAVRATLAKSELEALRRCARAVDAGLGRAVEVMLGMPSVTPSDRRLCDPRLKLLRDQLRRLRQAATPLPPATPTPPAPAGASPR